MVHEKHKIPVYSNTLNLVYDDKCEIHEMIEKLEIEDEGIDDILENSESSTGYTFCANGEYWICYHKNFNHGVIAHEIKHYLNFIYAQLDCKLSLEEDEHEAYFLGYITDLAYKFIKENKIKRQCCRIMLL